MPEPHLEQSDAEMWESEWNAAMDELGEIERLCGGEERVGVSVPDQVRELVAERDRYRQALQRILDMGCPLGREGDPLGEAQLIASAAIVEGGAGRYAKHLDR